MSLTRKRRSNRCVQPNRLDQTTVMFAAEQDAPDWHNWRFRSVALRVALRMVADGEAEQLALATENGSITCFRAIKRVGVDQLRRSPATLTFATMTAVGNATSSESLSSAERAHVAKFLVWPLIGDTKAVAVRPRISDRDRRQAERMMRPASTRPATSGRCYREARIRTLHLQGAA
jgi:hypothetical protein